MSGVDSLKPCPICKRETLLKHCGKEGKCGWFHCLNKACDALLDFAAKRGHVLDAPNGRRKVEFLPGGEIA